MKAKKFKTSQKDLDLVKSLSEQVIKFSDLTPNTLLHWQASAMINEYGFYTCIHEGKRTLIEL